MDSGEMAEERDYYVGEFGRRVTCRQEDFEVSWHEGTCPHLLVVAPHGGGIERGTARIGRLIARKMGASLYVFRTDVLKRNLSGFRKRCCPPHHPFHICSECLKSPRLERMLRGARVCISVHGWGKGEETVAVGGLYIPLGNAVIAALREHNVKAERASAPDPCGTNRCNFVNRAGPSAAGAGGVQLEIGWDLRASRERREAVAAAVAEAVAGVVGERTVAASRGIA